VERGEGLVLFVVVGLQVGDVMKGDAAVQQFASWSGVVKEGKGR
jgi:hypothetical protein